jgi:PAS domain S-box-containing protein
VVSFSRPTRWITICYPFLFFILFISKLCIVPGPAQAQPQRALEAKSILALPQQETAPPPSAKQILVLYTYAGGITVNQKATGAFFSVLTSRGLNNDDVFLEYLDLQRNDSPAYRRRVANLLLDKYGKRDIGLIVTVHTWALEFLLEECKGLFPDVPIFSFLVARPELIKAKNTGRRILLRPQNMDMGGTLEVALKMFPETRKVVFVVGAAPADKRFEHEARHIFEPWRGKVEIEYTSDRTYEGMLQLVATLPRRSIVIYCDVFSDVTGRTFTPLEVGKMVAKAANAPVFCIWDTIMGWGTIGGSLLSFEAEGAYAAKTALDILDKKIVLTKPETTLPSSKTYMFDWQQLRRWGVKESVLPKGSVLVNRVPTLWEQHRWLVIGSISVFLAQTLLVIGLLIQRNLKRKAESSLREKTEELDRFFEVNLDLLCIANTDGYFLRLNPAWETILGHSRDELMAKPFLDFVNPDDLLRTQEAVSAQVSRQRVIHFENRYRCKDGTYRWLEWSSVPAGKLIYAAARDITERKQAEDALKKSEERSRMLIETMNEGLGVRNENGVWTYVNDQLCWMLGDLHGGIIGHPVVEFLDEANQKIFEEEIEKQTKGNYSPYEITWTRTDGKKVTTIVSPKPIFNPEGQLKEVFAVFTDITERKQAEEALRQSEERFRQVAENVGDFIWEVDANGLYRYTSPSVEKILGYRSDELVGKRHFYDLFAPEVREELKAAALKVFAAKGSFRALPNPNISKEGRVVHLETSGVPVLDETGNLLGYRGVDIDVSERKRAEEELKRYQEHLQELVGERTEELIIARDQAEAANRAKSEFLSNMSHELRTPLNSILGIAQLMERDTGFPHVHRDTLNILSRSGAHLLELINDVLELSKVEAGKMTSNITGFDLHSFLGDLEEMIRLRADEKGLNLLFEYKSHLPRYIETDVRKLRQILINVLGNAIKYTDKGGVTLRVAFNEGMDTVPWATPSFPGRLEFEVDDTGIGIALEDRERIFEPFVQVHPGRTTGDGTGLGLTLSRMYVELLGGEFTLRSQLGRGSTFAFHLPIKLAEGAAIHTEETDRQVIGLMPGHPPYRVLVVDDSVENRLVLRRLLEQVGFDVLEAASGQEAVDLYESSQPHLFWMDLRMPGMDGIEVARRIRETESGKRNEEGKEIHTPIIALTAGVMGDERLSSHFEVFDGWVYKPFRETEIFDMLEKHLGVQFVCQPPVRSAADEENIMDTVALTPADLSILSADWLNEFYRVLRKGRSAELFKLIDQIRPEHGELAGTLAGLVRIHRFDKLIAVTEGALKENANG